MRVCIAEQLRKFINKTNEVDIANKISRFVEECKRKNFSFHLLSHGYYVREIKGYKNFYKFRVDKANRIIFQFIESEDSGEKELLILAYCNHDNQIRIAEGIANSSSNNRKLKRIEVNDGQTCDEELYEEYIDTYFNQNAELYTKKCPLQIVDDEQLAHLATLDASNAIYYLNKQQSSCLSIEGPLLLYGCAGSGKTTVTINKLFHLYQTLEHKVAYFTFSSYLKEETKMACEQLIKQHEIYEEEYFEVIDFYVVNEFLLEASQHREYMDYSKFRRWYESVIERQSKEQLKAKDVWRELRGIMRGCLNSDETKSRKQKSAFYIEHENELNAIYQQYRQMLKKMNLVDEKDLAQEVYDLAKSNQIEKYDYIIIDEVQDLTEWHLKALTALVENPNHLLLSGDINQSIYLNYCNPKIIGELLFNKRLAIQERTLLLNYRSCKEIVCLLNEIHQFRKSVLGMNKQFDYEEDFVRTQGVKPFRLAPKPENLESILQKVVSNADIVCLVSDEDQKNELKKKYHLNRNVFTVEEFKGIEKTYVVTYNLMSDHVAYWKKMFEGKVEGGHSQYRQCLNLFYVGLSRATQYLCVYEESNLREFDERFNAHFSTIEDYNEKIMNLLMSSTADDFYEAAKEYEQKELFSDAIEAYKLSCKSGVEDAVQRCEAKVLEREGQYEEAGLIFLKIAEYGLASRCFKRNHNDELFFKALVLDGKSYKEVKTEMKIDNTQMKKYLMMLDETWKADFLVREGGYCDALREEMHQMNKEIKEYVNKIAEGIDKDE